MLLLGLAYKYKCGCCNLTHYDQIKRHFNFWKKKKPEINKLTAIQEHLLFSNFPQPFEDFSILTKEGNDFKVGLSASKKFLVVYFLESPLKMIAILFISS